MEPCSDTCQTMEPCSDTCQTMEPCSDTCQASPHMSVHLSSSPVAGDSLAVSSGPTASPILSSGPTASPVLSSGPTASPILSSWPTASSISPCGPTASPISPCGPSDARTPSNRPMGFPANSCCANTNTSPSGLPHLADSSLSTVGLSPSGTKLSASVKHIASPPVSCHSNKSSTGPMCRICHEGESVGDLISPCLCMGTMGWIHKTCLEHWLTITTCQRCELCGFAYTIRLSPKPFWEFLLSYDSPEIRRAIVVDALCLLVLTPLAVFSIYLCVAGAFQYAQHAPASRDTVFSTRLITLNKHQIISTKNTVDTNYKSEEGGQPARQQKNSKGDSDMPWEAFGLSLLALLILTIYTAWAAVVVSYHTKVWRRWRVVHQDLTLVDNHRRPSNHPGLNIILHNVRTSFSPINIDTFGPFSPLPEGSSLS
ncbi:uncharacterized protein [Cherax quadricarinatus]